MKKAKYVLSLIVLVLVFNQNYSFAQEMTPAKDDGKMFILKKSALSTEKYHTGHAELFGKFTSGYNYFILQGIDKVQATAPDGGGYFTGMKVDPPESPIGYNIKFGTKELIKAPRKTSYCSGSSYAAFIEGMNLILGEVANIIPGKQYESLRMQELDGGRREDFVKFWGIWNADGFGSEFALEQYSEMGKRIEPNEARPGDFVNISWKSGNGHSVVFLGFYQDEKNEKYILFWSSQKSTNGYADLMSPLSSIKEVCFVRLTNPEKIFTFDVDKKVNSKIPGSLIKWEDIK